MRPRLTSPKSRPLWRPRRRSRSRRALSARSRQPLSLFDISRFLVPSGAACSGPSGERCQIATICVIRREDLFWKSGPSILPTSRRSENSSRRARPGRHTAFVVPRWTSCGGLSKTPARNSSTRMRGPRCAASKARKMEIREMRRFDAQRGHLTSLH